MARYLQSATLRSLLENPELLLPKQLDNPLKNGEAKKLDSREPFAGQAAFLGSNLWEKTFDLDIFADELKFDDADLAELLQVNSSQNSDSSQQSNQNLKPGKNGGLDSDLADLFSLGAIDPNAISGTKQVVQSYQENSADNSFESHSISSPEQAVPASPSAAPIIEKITEKVEVNELVTANIPGLEDFDPRKKRFSDEELLPQPIIKKSKRVFVNDKDKDDRYWAKRNKNNIAAKRSREARRTKENQIALRTAFLEKENSVLKGELEKFVSENKELKTKLAKYEAVH